MTLNVTQLSGFMAGSGNGIALIDALTALGLTTNLQLVFDAGDVLSVTSSDPDKWLDRGGSGYDFFRGSGTGADAADPAFNGNVGGLSQDEYWSFDGGDWFTYDGANETWMSQMHQTGKKNTLLAAIYVPATPAATSTLVATSGNISTEYGLRWQITSSQQVQYQIIGDTAEQDTSTITGNTSAWNIVGSSRNAATTSYHYINGVEESFTMTAVNTDAAHSKMQIGANEEGAEFNIIENGYRIAWLAIWDTNLTPANLDAIYAATRGRFGL